MYFHFFKIRKWLSKSQQMLRQAPWGVEAVPISQYPSAYKRQKVKTQGGPSRPKITLADNT